MIEIIIILVVIYICIRKASMQTYNSVFYKALKNQNFTNIINVFITANYTIVKADLKGENFLFYVKSNTSSIGVNEINFLYEQAKKMHIHNCILVPSGSEISQNVMRKIEDYNIEIWDNQKLQSLVQNSNDIQDNIYNKPILHTSNTSDDKCEIDPSKIDPIQDGESIDRTFLGGIFDKPDRL